MLWIRSNEKKNFKVNINDFIGVLVVTAIVFNNSSVSRKFGISELISTQKGSSFFVQVLEC